MKDTLLASLKARQKRPFVLRQKKRRQPPASFQKSGVHCKSYRSLGISGELSHELSMPFWTRVPNLHRIDSIHRARLLEGWTNSFIVDA